MKPTVIIKSLESQYILEDEKYQYILDNLDKPLPLAAIRWSSSGELTHFVIHYKDDTITIFNTNKPKGAFWNGVKFQFGKKKMHSYI